MNLSSRRAVLVAAATLPTVLYGRNSWAATGSIVPKLDDLQPAGTELPAFEFQTADGATRTIKDYAGQGVVLNFWATWCVPCVKEMPALAALAGLVKGANVVVLPLSSDRGGAGVVAKYYEDKGIAGLPVLLDARGTAARTLGARGIPTTVLIDTHGRERGRYEGAADWASPAAVAAVKVLAQ